MISSRLQRSEDDSKNKENQNFNKTELYKMVTSRSDNRPTRRIINFIRRLGPGQRGFRNVYKCTEKRNFKESSFTE